MSYLESQDKKLSKKGSSTERGESNFESKETKEDKELKELGAKERIEQTAVEVKTTKQRMKNIMNNMQQVAQAVKQIRQQLGLIDSDDEVPSIVKDTKILEELKEKLKGLEDQMGDLKKELKYEEINRLKELNPEISHDEADLRAEQIANEVFQDLQS